MSSDSIQENHFEFNKPWIFPAISWGMGLLFLLYFQYVNWTQYLAHEIFTTDAGMFDFVCSSFRHGHFMTFPLAWEAQVNYFAVHFRPIMIVIGFLYFISDHIMTLLFTLNAGLVFASVPLAYLVRHVLKHDGLALVIAALYLTSVFTRSIHLALHIEALVPLGFFVLFLAIEKRKTWLLIVAALYLFSNKEDIPLYTFGISFMYLVAHFFTKEKDQWLLKNMLMLLIMSVVFFIIANVTIEFAGADELKASGTNPLEKFGSMGESKSEVLIYLLTHPIETAGKILKPPLFYLLFSVGGFAFLNWKITPVAIAAASIFLIVDGPVGELNYYYSYAALPLAFIASIYGIQFVQSKVSNVILFHNIIVVAFALMAIGQLFLPTRTDGLHTVPFEPDPRHELLKEIINTIPDDASVAAQFDLYVQVPNRPVKLPLSYDHVQIVDYVLLDSNGKVAVPREEIPKILEVVNSDDFEVAFDAEGFQLLKRVGRR